MVCRRFVALGSLAIVLSALAIVPSCSDPACADGGVGCPCKTPYECGKVPACAAPYCDGTCGLIQLAVGAWCDLETCVDPEHCGGRCNETGTCLQCLDDSHCDSGHTCEPGNVCSRCDDGVKNGDEVAVDCGGSCSLCPGTCNVDADCPGGYCWQGVCARCDDGIQNGDETGVDCGGYDGHCGYCAGLYCQANNAQCASNNCEEGVCCSTPCPLCYKCRAPAGECLLIPVGYGDIVNATDPDAVCYGDNICDGKGKCALDYGRSCTQNEECASALCVNGKCA